MASCLPPLVPAIKEDAAGIVRNLLQLLLESDKYAERKGAAYGLAGLVKGLGILALKQQDIMTTLTDAIQDKKNFRRREGQWSFPNTRVWFVHLSSFCLDFTTTFSLFLGALFAFEMLCNMLGKLFEPYVVHVLPHLLLCFGDGNQYVREVRGQIKSPASAFKEGCVQTCHGLFEDSIPSVFSCTRLQMIVPKL